MRFFGDIFRLLRKTTWPTGKQSLKDFASVIEYTAFFVIIIFVFDWVISQGILNLVSFFNK